MQTDLNAFTSNACAYIAGWVLFSMSKNPKACSECLLALQSSPEDPLPDNQKHLIDIRNNGGLKTPSASMFKVCSAAEKVVKLNEARYGSKPPTTNIRQRMVIEAKSSLLSDTGNLFPSLNPHLNDLESDTENHYTQLIDQILNKYITLKLHFYTAKITESSIGVPIRSHFTKLILFKHQ